MSPASTARVSNRSATGRVGSPREFARSTVRPRLQIVGAPQQLQRRKVALTGAAIALGLGLLGLLLVTVSLGNGAYELHQLQNQSAQLTEQRNDLSEQLDDHAAPEVLRERARALGMVDAPKTVVIRRSDGTIAGVAEAAQPLASPATAPSSVASAKPSASTKSATKSKATP